MRLDYGVGNFRDHGFNVGEFLNLRFGVRILELIECFTMYIGLAKREG